MSSIVCNFHSYLIIFHIKSYAKNRMGVFFRKYTVDKSIKCNNYILTFLQIKEIMTRIQYIKHILTSFHTRVHTFIKSSC